MQRNERGRQGRRCLEAQRSRATSTNSSLWRLAPLLATLALMGIQGAAAIHSAAPLAPDPLANLPPRHLTTQWQQHGGSK